MLECFTDSESELIKSPLYSSVSRNLSALITSRLTNTDLSYQSDLTESLYFYGLPCLYLPTQDINQICLLIQRKIAIFEPRLRWPKVTYETSNNRHYFKVEGQLVRPDTTEISFSTLFYSAYPAHGSNNL